MSQFPTWASGSKVTAAQLTAMEPMTAWKLSNTSRASTTTLAADPDLVLNLSSGTYLIDGFWVITGGTTGSSDMKASINYTGSSTTAWWTPYGPTTASSTSVYQNGLVLGGAAGLGTYSTTTPVNAAPRGFIVAVSPGQLQVQWSQNTSSTTATVMQAGSWFRVQQVA
jgi:hypothetical protein